MGARTIRKRARRLIGGALALLALAVPLPAGAWGWYGHQTIAEIAMANVKPATRAKIRKLFAAERLVGTPDCKLSNMDDAATWPDCIRGDRDRWGHSGAWHYKDAPICEQYDPRADCPGGNCVNAQIERNLRILSDERLPDNVRLQALAFVVHFTGDIHQPLHSADDHDRGGNDKQVDYGIIPGRNLHSIWDTALAERAISSAQPPLVRRYSPAERARLAGGTPDDWGRESWQIARDTVYPEAFDQDACDEGKLPEKGELTQDDIVRAIPVVQRRVEQAGLRLADELDAAFAPGRIEEEPRAR